MSAQADVVNATILTNYSERRLIWMLTKAVAEKQSDFSSLRGGQYTQVKNETLTVLLVGSSAAGPAHSLGMLGPAKSEYRSQITRFGRKCEGSRSQ